MDDFNFESESRSGRRGSRQKNQTPDDDNLDDLLESFQASTKPQPLPRKNSISKQAETETSDPPQAVSGWGDSGINRNPRRRDAGASLDFGQDLFSQNTKKVDGVNQREFNSNNDTDDIPEIPDLEENEVDTTEDMAFMVAEAPDVQVHQISTYKELDKEFFREKAFQFLEGNIDVSLLHCGLNTENQISEEEDVIWEWTKLFTEVVSVLSALNEADSTQTEDNSFTDDQKNSDKISDIFNSKNSGGDTKRERNIVF